MADLLQSYCFTARIEIGHTGSTPLAHVIQGGKSLLRLYTRTLDNSDRWSRWNRLQNYRRYPDGDGIVRVLECEVMTRPPAELIDMLRERHAQTKPEEVFHAEPEMLQGLMRVGVPLTVLGRNALQVLVQVTAGRIALLVDGVVVDEQWPTGLDLEAKEMHVRVLSDDVKEAVILPRVLTAQEIVAHCDGENAVARRRAELLGPEQPIGQYWAPAGHNCWAGDAMLCTDGERLHLYWLLDRRMGTSKWGCGASQFAHASTTDLRHWTQYPLAFPLTEPWEATIGTGCVVYHAGIHYAFSNIVNERLGRIARQHPAGVYLATSGDGLQFTKQGFLGVTGEPGMVRDDNGLFHAVSSSRHIDGVWRTARLTSRDLVHWEMADKDFLPQPGWPTTREVFSSECFCWFAWGGWWYIVGGRTGMWKALALLGPYVRCRQDIYDGLLVPQAAVFGGRAIMAGWILADRNEYAGHLVFRELLQRADGDLDMRRLPELEPKAASTHKLPDVEVSMKAGVQMMPLPDGNMRLRMTLRPGRSPAPYGVRIAGAELQFDSQRQVVQWGTPHGDAPAPDAVMEPCMGGDFAILHVQGLEQAVHLDLLVWHDAKSDTVMLDAQIDARRTIITRRSSAAISSAMLFSADGGLCVSDMAVSELAPCQGTNA